MPGGINTVLSFSMREQLFAAQKTARAIAETQLRLSTGRKVNSALDNPQNFFTARTLDNRRSDLTRLLDNIGQNIQAVKEADLGLRGLLKQLDLMESFIDEAEIDLLNGNSPLSDLILADNPDGYWKLNDIASGTAENLGNGGAAINGTTFNSPTNTTGSRYLTGDIAGEFDGINQHIRIPDSNLINTSATGARTVEVVFEADNPDGARQVIYEEGGTVNAFAIYVENGRLYMNGRDAGAWGPVDISTEVEAGKTYHAAFVFDGDNQEFRAYLNGEEFGTADTGINTFPSHTNDIGIGGMRQNSYFHDGPGSGNDFFFDGRISDVALYNDVITEDGLKARYDATRIADSEYYETEFQSLLDQYNGLIDDTQYRGNNLLKGDTLRTDFNETRSSFLKTEGRNVTSAALEFGEIRLRSATQIAALKATIDDARESVRSYGESLASDLNIIQTRERFTQELINTLAEGADRLTLADQNKEGAKMLALQVRQQLQTTGLSLAAQSQFSVLRLVNRI